MEHKKYKVPPIVWLKLTDYMHGWLQSELGGGSRVGDQRVVSVQHLPNARNVLRMETMDDIALEPMKMWNSMSATRRNMMAAGLELDEDYMEREYGMTKALMKLFVPIECPKMTLTKYGVMRPWSLDTNLSRRQANELIQVVRTGFWEAVEEFDDNYAVEHRGEKYAAADMVEAFCKETQTLDKYEDAIRREWQRRLKNGHNKKD